MRYELFVVDELGYTKDAILQNKDRHNRPDEVEPYVVRLVAHAIVGREQPADSLCELPATD
jgi:hypothetical protein